MEKLQKEYYLIDEEAFPVEEPSFLESLQRPQIYEVIRLQRGVPLFLEEHVERMKRSSEARGYDFEVTYTQIKKRMRKLALLNEEENLNVKMLYSKNDRGGYSLAMFFNESYYPEASCYEEGVDTITASIQRSAPTVKIQDDDYKNRIASLLEESGAFEVILLNEENKATEGSKSNLFFIKERKIFTSPPEKVLMGITRKKVMEAIEEEGLEVVFSNVSLSEISEMDGAFLTGTSIDVLPIRRIDDVILSSSANEVVKQLMGGYRERVARDIQSYGR